MQVNNWSILFIWHNLGCLFLPMIYKLYMVYIFASWPCTRSTIISIQIELSYGTNTPAGHIEWLEMVKSCSSNNKWFSRQVVMLSYQNGKISIISLNVKKKPLHQNNMCKTSLFILHNDLKGLVNLFWMLNISKKKKNSFKSWQPKFWPSLHKSSVVALTLSGLVYVCKQSKEMQIS